MYSSHYEPRRPSDSVSASPWERAIADRAQGFTVGGFYTGTDMTTAQKTNYTNAANAGSRFLGKDTVTVYLLKTF